MRRPQDAPLHQHQMVHYLQDRPGAWCRTEGQCRVTQRLQLTQERLSAPFERGEACSGSGKHVCSLQGQLRAGRGSGATASHALLLRFGFELDEDHFHTPVADVLGKVRHGARPVGVAIV